MKSEETLTGPLGTAMVVLLSLSLIACSDTSDPDDWAAFERFAKKDRQGEKIDCSALINTRIEKGISGMSGHQWTDDLVDYIYESGYSFLQCQQEIDQFVNAFCDRNTPSAVASFMDETTGNTPGRTYEQTCTKQFRSALSQISYRYEIPESKGGILRLEDNGVMLFPSSITSIEFGQVISDALWYIKIITDNDKHRLYYGDKAQWEAAKSELANVASGSI